MNPLAEKRMFTQKIIDSDAFLDMPLSTQALYFHLNMKADDDGFVNNPKRIQRAVCASEDDLKLLIAKRFLICFDNGVIVIKHWRMHNTLKNDRYRPTQYQEEYARLEVKGNKAYTERLPEAEPVALPAEPEWNQNGSSLEPQYSIDKDSIVLDKDSTEEYTVSKDTVRPADVQQVVEKWNSLGLSQIRSIKGGTKRYDMLKRRIKDYGLPAILEALDNVQKSAYLKGGGKNGWVITFDWFILPNNFVKVLDGNYNDRREGNADGKHRGSTEERAILTGVGEWF